MTASTCRCLGCVTFTTCDNADETEYLPTVDYDAAECPDCLCCRRGQCDRQTCSGRCPCAHD